MTDYPEELVAQFGWIRRLARAVAQDAALGDDLAQETLLAALQKRPDLHRPLRPWLATILRNFARMRARQARRSAIVGEAHDNFADPTPSAATQIEQLEAERKVARFVTELPEPYRQTVLLRYYQDLTAAEMARQLGIPAGTVRSRLSEGLSRVRKRLDREYGGRRRWMFIILPRRRRLPFFRAVPPFGVVVAAAAVALVVSVAHPRAGAHPSRTSERPPAALTAGVWTRSHARSVTPTSPPPPARSSGATCQVDDDCGPNELCTYAPAPTTRCVGSSCSGPGADAECGPGKTCFSITHVDRQIFQCFAAGARSVGEACDPKLGADPSRACLPGLYCSMGECAPTECTSAQDCPTGTRCANLGGTDLRSCVASCDADTDCKAGQTCAVKGTRPFVDKMCTAASRGRRCPADGCGAGYMCDAEVAFTWYLSAECVKTCSSDRDCGTGQFCEQAVTSPLAPRRCYAMCDPARADACDAEHNCAPFRGHLTCQPDWVGITARSL
jgi:RNA polymerase sigma-70 factor (ECF subfamily)